MTPIAHYRLIPKNDLTLSPIGLDAARLVIARAGAEPQFAARSVKHQSDGGGEGRRSDLVAQSLEISRYAKAMVALKTCSATSISPSSIAPPP